MRKWDCFRQISEGLITGFKIKELNKLRANIYRKSVPGRRKIIKALERACVFEEE